VNNLRLHNSLAIGLPVLSFFLAGGLAFYHARRAQHLESEWELAGKQIAALDTLITTSGSKPRPARFPTAEQSSQEQPNFLNVLRAYADGAHVRFVHWSNNSANTANNASVASASGSDNKEAQGKSLPPDVTAIVSQVEIAGHYLGIRDFLYSILRSPRLLNLTDIKWMRDDTWPQTHVTFTLTRYVAPPGKAALRDSDLQALTLAQSQHPVSPGTSGPYAATPISNPPGTPVVSAAAPGKL